MLRYEMACGFSEYERKGGLVVVMCYLAIISLHSHMLLLSSFPSTIFLDHAKMTSVFPRSIRIRSKGTRWLCSP